MSEVETENINIEEELSKLKSGDLYSIVPLLYVYEEQTQEKSILISIAESIAANAKPIEWEKNKQEIALFAQVSFEIDDAIRVLGSTFARVDMLEFTNFYFSTMAKNVLGNPERTTKILLFITSHAVQNTPNYYERAIPAYYAAISIHAESPEYPKIAQSFEEFINFDPEATQVTLQNVMKDSFIAIKNTAKGQDNYATLSLVNQIRFWSRFAFKNENFGTALVQICEYFLTKDQTLVINPFRMHVIEILIEYKKYMTCVAPLTKIFEKSKQLKQNSKQDFDWDTLMISTKEIARNPQYQQMLYEKSQNMLLTCLIGLCHYVTFPEIVAPVTRAIRGMIDNPIYENNQGNLKKFLTKIQQNSDWMQKERKTLCNAQFNIGDVLTIEGKPPLAK